jgi:hypothetical protein
LQLAFNLSLVNVHKVKVKITDIQQVRGWVIPSVKLERVPKKKYYAISNQLHLFNSGQALPFKKQECSAKDKKGKSLPQFVIEHSVPDRVNQLSDY